MPQYRFYDLNADRAENEQMKLFDDHVAIRRAISERYPQGCEIWEGERFVGRFHRASDAPLAP